MKTSYLFRLLLPCLTLAVAATEACAAQLRLVLESAPTPNGPWSREDLGRRDHDANGNPLLPATTGRAFYRTIVETSEAADPGGPIELPGVPEEFLSRAKSYLEAGRDGDDGWGPEAEIQPEVLPVYDITFNEGKTPAFLEFKVGHKHEGPRPGAFPNRNSDCLMEDLGFILVSLHEGESPVPRCATRGQTIVEQLQCRAKTRLIKVFSFGGTFFTAEDSNGRTLANLGEVPFKVDPTLVETLRTDKRWLGDSDTGQNQRPKDLPRSTAVGYPTVDAFKMDYLTNPVYKKLRERRALRAGFEWNVERGEYPAAINLRPGDIATAFPGKTIGEYRFETEAETPLVTMSTPTTGGVRLTALAPGDGILLALFDGKPSRVSVHITGEEAGAGGARVFTPGWQAWETTILPGGYDDTPKYDQLQDDNWCSYVGCGPNAIAMLVGYYDRHGVPGAFGNLTTSDAPPDTSTASRRAILRPQLDIMHELCDVICPPFSDAGATLPGDEAEGLLGYMLLPVSIGWVKMSWDMRWSGLFSTFDEGATETRTAVKKGRPSVLGLGEYWHYVLAYGYRVRPFKVTANGPVIMYQRQLRCNMGWGPGAQPQWWGFYDTFFSSNVGMWKGPFAPP